MTAASGGRFGRMLQRQTTEPIAVVGLACRFPMAPGIEAYRRLLGDGVQTRREVPPERWDIDAYYSAEPGVPGTMITRHGGFVDEIDRFDAGLFRCPPREAEAMDPQHRMLLEVGWEAFESAGMPLGRLAGSPTGVFVGISTFDYSQRLHQRDPDGYMTTGMAHSAAAGRLSYFFNLRGPCEAIDTACSGSLVAIHRACQSLRAQEIDAALAGGVNAMFDPTCHIGFSQAGMLAPDGRCKTFDAAADGYARGEGCGVVVLKRLSDAQRDGDVIHAIVPGSAENHGGRTQKLTAPSGPAQEDVVRRALRQAGLTPDDVDVVEAHGTGTPLGDPQELHALAEVFAGRAAGRARVQVGSAKTSLGHLEAAAGIAGFLRLVLMARDGVIFPHLNLEQLNPEVDFTAMPLEVPVERRPWPRRDGRRIGGVSSFGFSGSNAHVLVEAPPEEPAPRDAAADDAASTHLLPLSGRTPEALGRVVRRWRRHLQEDVGSSLADLAHGAALGRTHMEHRAAVVGVTRADWIAALDRVTVGEPATGARDVGLRIAFLFTGQGSQRAGMGRGLYEEEPVFRAALDECASILREEGRPLLEVMFGEGGDGAIDRTEHAQPALFALEYGLFQVWQSWGIRPWAVLGHSVGELAAACAVGALELRAGLRLVAERGRLMQGLTRAGAMMSVRASEPEVREALSRYGERVSVAGLNGPRSVVVSGERGALGELTAELVSRGIRTRELTVSHAFHSSLMDPILGDLEAAGDRAGAVRPGCALVSNLSGRALEESERLDGSYWRRHAREPVRFESGIRWLVESGTTVFVELGPRPVLSGMAREFADQPTYLASLSPEREDRRQMLESLGALYAGGAAVDWAGVHRGRGGRKVSLPTYPFERTRHWMEGDRAGQPRRSPRPGAGGHPLLGARVSSAGVDARFESELGADLPAYLGDHRVYGLALLPAAGFVELALAAARELAGDGPCELRDLSLERALVLPDGERRRCQVVLTPRADQPGHDVQVYSRAADEVDPAAPWLRHAAGVVVPGEPSIAAPPDGDSAAVDPVDLGPFYRALGDRGMAYGGSFRGLVELWRGRQGDGTAAARAELPASAAEGGRLDLHRVHPALLDACFHSLGGALASRFALGNAIRMAYLPVAIGRVAFVRPPGARVRCRARVELDPGGLEYTGDVWILDEEDRVVLAVEGMRMQGVERGQLRAASLQGGAVPDARQRLLDAAPADRWSIMVQVLVDLVSEIVGIGADEVDESLMYFELGMSSLASVELQYRLQRGLRCRLGADLAVDYQTTASLARLLLVQVVGPDGFEDPEQAGRH